MARFKAVPFVLFMSLLFASGCGKAGFHPTRGQFLYSTGAPVTELDGFQVVFEGATPDGKRYSATGTINANGEFEMFTDKPGDGAPGGTCKVLIEPKMIDSEREAPYPLDRKYRSFDTSELTAEVKEGANDFKFTVEPKKKVTGAGK